MNRLKIGKYEIEKPIVETMIITPNPTNTFFKLSLDSDLNLDIVAENGELVQAHFRSSLLDLLAAFDTNNLSILKLRLQTSFGLSSSGSLLIPYLSPRPRPVYVNHSKSLPTILQFRVSQGSVLGPKSQISDDTQHYATAHLSKAFGDYLVLPDLYF